METSTQPKKEEEYVNEFDVNLFANTSFGSEGDHTNAIYQVANQLRFRNYIELLKMRDRTNVIKEVKRLIKELQEE